MAPIGRLWRASRPIRATIHRPATRSRLHWVGATALSATLVLAGCSGPSGVLRPTTTTTTTGSTTSTTSTTGPHSRTESPGAVPAGRPAWIVSESAVALLREAGLSRRLVAYFFNNTNTFLLLSGPEHIRRELPLACATESFTSYAALKHAFAINAISAGTRAILYDNENWSLTPLPERAQPILYAARAEALVHRHRMKFVFTPASDLADAHVRSPGAGGSSYQRYLEQGLAGRGARVSDVFEIQSQQIEGTSAFLPFATLATAQAKAANPDAMLLLGIGTNPGGRSVTARALLHAYLSTRTKANGYWLNIPSRGRACPSCGIPQPQVAVAFLLILAQLSRRQR